MRVSLWADLGLPTAPLERLCSLDMTPEQAAELATCLEQWSERWADGPTRGLMREVVSALRNGKDLTVIRDLMVAAYARKAGAA